MALNPDYVQQSTRPLPFCVGWVYATGSKTNSIVGFDGTTCEEYILAEGEWDSCVYLSVQPGDRFMTGNLVGGGYGYGAKGATLNQTTIADRPIYYHFHAGRYGTKGLPNNQISVGPDNNTDTWDQYFPSVTPALTHSGLVYYLVRRTITTVPMQPVGIYKSLKCREFDANGDVTGYGFTTNPTWQMIEAILRYQIKPQQPTLAGLTNAEKACFDWPAMVAHAQRNAVVLSNGKPRFAGNFSFAAGTTLAAMSETMLRNCRSYKRERGNKISFAGDDQRAPVFTVSARHLAPGSLKIQKKDLSNAANVIVPQYRDLEIPAVTAVATVTVVPVNSQSSNVTFTTTGAQPFAGGDVFTYAGSNNDGVFAGEWQVHFYQDSNGNFIAPPIANQFNTFNGPAGNVSAIGGYLGTQQSRFKQRAPTGVQHRSHQATLAKVAPGIAGLPRQVPVQYDLGNNTFDQTNRIAKFIRDRDLGTDGPGWLAPFAGSLSLFVDRTDDDGRAVLEIENGDVITLDDTASPEFAGDFEVRESTHRFGDSELDLELYAYNPSAATDVSDPPGSSYQTLSGASLPWYDTFPAAQQFWLMRATPKGAGAGGGNLTITIPDVSIWWEGDEAPVASPPVAINVPTGRHIIVYLNVTTPTAAPTLSYDVANTYPPVPLPVGQVVVFIGTLSASSLGALDGGAPSPVVEDQSNLGDPTVLPPDTPVDETGALAPPAAAADPNPVSSPTPNPTPDPTPNPSPDPSAPPLITS